MSNRTTTRAEDLLIQLIIVLYRSAYKAVEKIEQHNRMLPELKVDIEDLKRDLKCYKEFLSCVEEDDQDVD